MRTAINYSSRTSGRPDNNPPKAWYHYTRYRPDHNCRTGRCQHCTPLLAAAIVAPLAPSFSTGQVPPSITAHLRRPQYFCACLPIVVL